MEWLTVEAMAAGLPIVATNFGRTIEILKSGELGFLRTRRLQEILQ